MARLGSQEASVGKSNSRESAKRRFTQIRGPDPTLIPYISNLPLNPDALLQNEDLLADAQPVRLHQQALKGLVVRFIA